MLSNTSQPTHSSLSLPSFRLLPVKVCGSPEVDLSILKANTNYRVAADSQQVRLFWRALESFSNEERRLFLRFAWGRSRLPGTGYANLCLCVYVCFA